MDSSSSLPSTGEGNASPVGRRPSSPVPAGRRRPSPPSWDEIGDGFETIGKVGLAMAVGFSAAGLFCRLAQQGKVRVPPLTSLLLNLSATRGERPERLKPE